MRYSAAIDLSGSEAAFAVAGNDDRKLVFEQFKPMRGRSSSALITWMLELLQEHGIDRHQVVNWTVGSGPGSFTGMRLVAAMVGGLAFGHDEICTRCVPSALALAAEAGYDENVAAIFDGRNHELLLYGAGRNSEGTLVPLNRTAVFCVKKAADILDATYFQHFVALEKDRAAIEKIVPEALRDDIKYFEHLPVSELIFSKYGEWDNDLTKLVYIRPAVFTEPLAVPEVR